MKTSTSLEFAMKLCSIRIDHLVCMSAGWFALAIPVRAQDCSTSLISLNSAGAQANRDSYMPIVSRNGRVVVFYSDASNLVSGDNNSRRDVFLRDRATLTTEMISVASSGAPGNNDSYSLAVSTTGRFVVFMSDATTLVPLDTNAKRDIFLRDRSLGSTERISVSSSGVQSNGWSYSADVSADGRFVVFANDGSNLDPTDFNGQPDVYVRDRTLGTTTLLTRGNTGLAAAGVSDDVHCTPDFRYISFTCSALDLLTPSLLPYAYPQVYVYDSLTAVFTLETIDPQGGGGNADTLYQSISDDGQMVAFTTRATDLVPGSPMGTADVFVRNRQTHTTSHVSVPVNGSNTNGLCGPVSISANGRYVAYDSVANNLFVGDTNGRSDIFVRDLATGTTTLASVSIWCGLGTEPSQSPSISADGRIVVFDSIAAQLIGADLNDYRDVFLNDRQPQANFYCTGKINSLGCLPSITLSGWPSASAGSGFSINASQFRNQKLGLLLYSTGGPLALPWYGGVMCVGLPRVRTPIQSSGGSANPASDCTGTYQFDFNAWIVAGSDPGLAAGQQVWGQYWARDPGYTPPYNVSLTNGTTFTLDP